MRQHRSVRGESVLEIGLADPGDGQIGLDQCPAVADCRLVGDLAIACDVERRQVVGKQPQAGVPQFGLHSRPRGGRSRPAAREV